VRDGHNKCGSSHYHCHSCGTYRVLFPSQVSYSAPFKATVLRACHERASLRGLERVFHVCRQTIATWIVEKVQQLPPLHAPLAPARADDVLELYELSSVKPVVYRYGGCGRVTIWMR